jgi:lysine 2,3-aminomutase
MLSDSDLGRVIDYLLQVDPSYILRICTRIPVVHPARVTAHLVRILRKAYSAWIVIQANHPRELTDEFRGAVRRLVTAGVPVLNQAVLLRSINDDTETLEELFRGLVRAGVKPYYLFQGDLVAGTAHFRVSLGKGIALMRELRARLSGMAMPTYAVDLPGGGGKVPVELSLVRTEQDAYVLRGPEGKEYRYPREE